MSPEERELARRLAAHERWEWRPGMQDGFTYSRYPLDQGDEVRSWPWDADHLGVAAASALLAVWEVSDG